MNSLSKLLFLVVLTFYCHLQALETRPCYVQDNVKHQKNKELLASIIEEKLSNLNLSSYEKSRYLSRQIHQITKELIYRGFDLSAYQVPEINDKKTASFSSFMLWEGARKTVDSVPLTFFVYVWPSEKRTRQHHGVSCRSCRSSIHSHPISCALSVLSGSLTQRRFYCIDLQRKAVQMIRKDIFNAAEGEIDDLREPFIHQLCNESEELMALSLHAYGLSREDEVRNCFEETFFECSFYQ